MITCNVTVGGILATPPKHTTRPPHILDLHQAIVTGDVTGVRRLAEGDLDLGVPVRGTTALSLAVYRGDLTTLTILVSAGAPLNRRSRDHLDRLETPIISAIRLGHREIFEELVNRGARLDLKDFYNQTPLWFAVKEQRLHFVGMLLRAGAPIDFTRATENPLNVAVQFLGYRGRREMALELVGAGLPLGLEDYKGHSPLYYAMKHIDLHFFRLLVEAGAPLRQYEWMTEPHLPHSWRENDEVLSWLREETNSPQPLKRLCRTLIYTTLRTRRKTDVRPLLQSLPLPQPLLRYLRLERLMSSAAAFPPNHGHQQQQVEIVPPPQLPQHHI
ncbi:hypothetical protein Pcinc_030672 [Petrolisthes cinctipes]|uniref:SOCS box domain-containing protein n=1 Tax=Petrolisthes cinctipes TaxID=88211 RepID=A0AAE1EYB2_PETCI|nr:hypothetical protein Pcinc_030672 [Petrolisthes cinctipes]